MTMTRDSSLSASSAAICAPRFVAVVGEEVGDLRRESKVRQRERRTRARSRAATTRVAARATPAHHGAPKAVAISASGTSPFLRMSVRRVSVVSPLASTICSETSSLLRPTTTTRCGRACAANRSSA